MSLDQTLTLAAAGIELGVPAVCFVAWARRPSWRPALAVMLGAATPWIILYASAVGTWLARPSKASMFGALAIWEMSFVFYACNLGVAAVLAGFATPRRLKWRAAMGASPAVAIGAIALISTFGRW